MRSGISLPSLRGALATKQSIVRALPFLDCFAVLAMTMVLTGCATMKSPSISGDPARMSADTLCYRGAYARSSEAIQSEIAARNLDCRAILAQQPVFHSENGL